MIYLALCCFFSFLVQLFTDFEFLARLLVKEVPQVTQDISEVPVIVTVMSYDMLMGHLLVYVARGLFWCDLFLLSCCWVAEIKFSPYLSE